MRWKLRGLRDKYLLRRLAERWLPRSIARRHKAMFRAPLDSFHEEGAPPFVAQLLSEESLRKTGYFDPQGVRRACEAQSTLTRKSLRRFSLDLGLSAVISTQLWHHTYCGGGLADLPVWSPPLIAEHMEEVA